MTGYVTLWHYIDLWQGLLTDLFINKLEWATIEDLHKTYIKLLLKPKIHHISWYRPWHFFIVSASSIFWLSALMSSLFQSGLLEDCCDAFLLAWNKWLWRYTKGLDNGAPLQYLLSSPIVCLTSIFWLLCHHPVT